MTHEEIGKKSGSYRRCSAHDLFSVAEGLQCGNCLAVTRDHGATWEEPRREGKSEDDKILEG